MKSRTKKSTGTHAKARKGYRKTFTSDRSALFWAWSRSLDRTAKRWREVMDSWQSWWR